MLEAGGGVLGTGVRLLVIAVLNPLHRLPDPAKMDISYACIVKDLYAQRRVDLRTIASTSGPRNHSSPNFFVRPRRLTIEIQAALNQCRPTV